MNQDLLNPPSVEGWHTGKEWIDSGSMVERINFVADNLGDIAHPGVRTIVATVDSTHPNAAEIVNGCLELLGSVALREDNWNALVAQAAELLDTGATTEDAILNALRMIGSTREYQFA
jgi:hypothetical protein